MYKRMLAILAATTAVFAIACGGTEEPSQVGSLDIQVLGFAATADEVTKVTVTLDGEVDYAIDLTAETSVKWTGKFEKVLTGSYEAKAVAYDASNDAIFTSAVQNVEIGPNGGLLTFVLNEERADDVDVPRFVSIQLDRTAVEWGGEVALTVRAEAKSLSSLCGKYSGSNADPVTDKPDPNDSSKGAFIADDWPPYCSSDFSAVVAGAGGSFVKEDPDCDDEACIWTATTIWTANKAPGAVWFILRAWNAEAIAEMGVVVVVTPARVDEDLEVVFNRAPEIAFDPIRVLPVAGSTTVYFSFTATDPDPELGPGNLTYGFVANDCVNEGTFSAASGVVASGGQHDSRYDVSNPQSDSCSVTLTVTDSKGASIARKITFQTNLVGDSEGRTTFTGFDTSIVKGVARAFTVTPNVQAKDIVEGKKLKMRMALYNPAGNRVPNFATDALAPTKGTDAFDYLWIDGVAEAGVAPFDGTTALSFELQAAAIPAAGTYRMVVEFIDVSNDAVNPDDGAAVAGDFRWISVVN